MHIQNIVHFEYQMLMLEVPFTPKLESAWLN